MHAPPPSRLLPSLRIALLLAVVASASTAWAQCFPPQNDAYSWIYVGEIAQNIRVRSVRDSAVGSWSTVDSMTNRLAVTLRHTLSASQTENVIVSFRLLFFGIAYSGSSTTQHSAEVSIPPGHRARLMRQRREEMTEYLYDIVCAWRHRTTGQAAITSYGRNYADTVLRLYDAFEVRTERI